MKSGPKTIALDTTYGVGRNLSGVGVYTREIANALAALHPESKFLYCYRSQRFVRAVTASRAPNSALRLLRGGFPSGFDLFHGLNQRLDRRYRRAVVTFHDLFVLTSVYSTPEFRERFAVQAREAAERSDSIIAVSEFTAGQVEDLLKVDRARIRVVAHGVRVPAGVESVAREPIVLFAGAIQKRKNVLRLVEAFERTRPGWTLVLAGSTGFGAEEILQAVKKSPRREDIRVAGYVPDAELEQLYRRASIFAFPSLDEGFGIPVLEAMARGLPVLTSNRSSLPEVAGDAALLVDPSDTDAIMGGLVRLMEDSELRAGLARKGLERSAMYTWERAAGATWGVYEEVW